MKSLRLAILAFSLVSVATVFPPNIAVFGQENNVIINEIELNPAGTDSGSEKVEIYNASPNDVDISGWSISSTAGRASSIVIDSGTVVATNSHFVIGRGSQWLDNVGESIVLEDDHGITVDRAGPFSDGDNSNETWQRSPDGSDNWIFSSSTLGSQNVGTTSGKPDNLPKEKPKENPSNPQPNPSGGKLKVIVIDVGQGLSQLVVMPIGKSMLIDGGDTDKGDTVLAALNQYGVTKLDAVVATHPHADHIGGLVDVLNTIEVSHIYDSGQIHTTKTFENYLDAIEKHKIPLDSVHQGDVISLDPSVKLDVLNPPSDLQDGADDPDEFNNNSVVIKLTYGEFTMLFSADTQDKNEERLVNSDVDLDSDILVAGHHGSDTSSTTPYLQAISPDIVIISVGADNSYGHPHPDALARINTINPIHIFRTDVDGTIVLTTDGSSRYTVNEIVVPEFGSIAVVIASVSIASLIVVGRIRTWRSLKQV